MAQSPNTINPILLTPEVQQWIRQTMTSLEEIAFAPIPFDGISRQELLQQVEGYRKTAAKVPVWAQIPGLLFPVKISLEQCSSETTAHYKALVAGQVIPRDASIADLTGGFGVDTYYLAQSGAQVHHFELDKALSNLVAHNMTLLKTNVVCHHGDGIQGIKDMPKNLDLIYLDPARRDAQKNKVFRLEDCQPDLVTHLNDLLTCSDNILLKTSPMLDLHLGLKQLKWVTQIHVVAVNNEVKELLWLIQKHTALEENPQVFAANLSEGNFVSSSSLLDLLGSSGPSDKLSFFKFQWNRPEANAYSPPLAYLYEPNAPLRKIGQYAALTEQFPILRIGPNAHLFTAERLLDFPGRVFKVTDKWPFAKGVMKQFKGKQLNITTRDFPQTVAQIRALWRVKEGGQEFLFLTTDAQGQKWIILCHKPE